MKTKQPRSASLRVRVTPDELAELQRVADREARTVSQLVWLAVRRYLDTSREETTA
jgi:hypothetical protein